MDPVSAILFVGILIFSVVIHENAHGYTALSLGDHTAKNAGRLTLNPIPHIDPIGSILVPFLFIISLGIPFGWAKPVPVNPYNLRDQKYGSAKVSVAGPGVNLAIFLLFGLALRFLPIADWSVAFASIFALIAGMNLLLAYFNLLPIPPLDGSHVFFTFAPASFHKVRQFLFQYGFYILLGLIFVHYIAPAYSPLRILFVPASLIFELVVGFSVF